MFPFTIKLACLNAGVFCVIGFALAIVPLAIDPLNSVATPARSTVEHLLGIIGEQDMDSISGDANYLRFSTNSKSGQFFFFSNDGDYMIKTISHEEVKVLQSILPEYYEHLVQNPASLIVRITGLYRVRMYHLHRTVYFIVMGSCFRGSTPRMMDRQYDIKGSTVGRNCAPGDDVRKDNDLVADGFRLRLGRNREAAGLWRGSARRLRRMLPQQTRERL